VSWLDRLEHLDRRWIFLAIGLILLYGLLGPLGPLQPQIEATAPVQAFYDRIDAAPEGSTILVPVDYDAGSLAELNPIHIAILHHAFRRNLKVISFTLWEGGRPFASRAFGRVAPEYGKVYGVDYIDLGFKAGKEINMVTMGTSIPDTFKQDYKARPISEFPIMRGIKNYEDLELIVDVSAGYPGTEQWVQAVPARFGIDLISGCAAVSAPEFYPYLQSKLLKGLIGGMGGASEYEKLLGLNLPTGATSGMGGQLTGHLGMIGVILFGNLLLLIRVLRGRKEVMA